MEGFGPPGIFSPSLKMLNKKPDIFCLATSSLHSKKKNTFYGIVPLNVILPYIPHLASLTQHYSPPFRTSEGAAFSTQVRVGIFRTKVDLKKLKWRNRIRSFEGAEYSTQVSAPRERTLFPPPSLPRKRRGGNPILIKA